MRESVVGGRNLDRISMTDWRAKCETVGDMWRAGWRQVRARCDACRGEFQIDLSKVIRERGPKVSLWNRRQGCPKEACPGQVEFMVRIPGLHFYQVMTAGDPPTAPRRPTLGERAARDREGDG
jgi:hypothetical protein